MKLSLSSRTDFHRCDLIIQMNGATGRQSVVMQN